jgi:hypothetical protein
MGTRADFYIGRGADAEWLGSVAWDGYPDGFDKVLFQQKRPSAWRRAVEIMLASREDATTPDLGWPWPWEDSNTTDYAYAYDAGKIYGSSFGSPWWRAPKEPEEISDAKPKPVFPNMKARQKTTLGKRSGVIIIGAPKS